MTKLSLIITIAVASASIVALLPGMAESIGHGLHWITITVSAHHISEEVAHAIHPHKALEHE